jgi:multisite-specific tRNA:(cytosine-C5)-methyltransferase
MALPLWKSFQSLNLMLPKEDRSAMLLRIYNDTTPLINMGIQKKAVDGAAAEAKEGGDDDKDAEMKDAAPAAAAAEEAQAEEAVVEAADVEVADAPAPEAVEAQAGDAAAEEELKA